MKQLENRALVISSPEHLHVTKWPVNDPGTREVLVRTRYVALCGSDVKLYQGTYSAPHQYPIVIGHEWVGEIVKVGEGVADIWHPGDIVTGDCTLYCNHCENCLRDYRNHCAYVEKKGITTNGGCAQYINVNPQHLYRCPELPDLKPLALIEPLAVSVEAVINRISQHTLKKIRRALIIGSGGIGALAVLLLHEQGIPEITVADVVAEKLGVIDVFGFKNVKTVLTNLSDDILSDRDGFDLIFEGAGSESALCKSIELAAPRATVVCVGHQGKVELDFSEMMRKSLTVISSLGSTGGFEKAIQIVAKHYLKVQKLITRVVDLDQVELFFKEELGQGHNIKVIIDMK